MSTPTFRLPPAIKYGFVSCQIIIAGADSNDVDRKPDAYPVEGSVTFTPIDPRSLEADPDPVIVYRKPISGSFNSQGRLTGADGVVGLWLPVGGYTVTYSLKGVSVESHGITVTEENTEANPLHLPSSSTVTSTPITPTQYQFLLSRIEALTGVDESALIIGWDEVNNKPQYFNTEWSYITNKPLTFPPTIGTTSTTAKAGNYTPTWSQVTGKPTTFAPIIGVTSTTAKPGNYVPSWTEVTGKPTTFTPSGHSHSVSDINATGTMNDRRYLSGAGTWEAPGNGANVSGVCLRLYSTGIEVHSNGAHVNNAVTGFGPNGDGLNPYDSSGRLIIKHSTSGPVISMVASPDESLVLLGVAAGLSGGSGETVVQFVKNGSPIDLRNSSQYASIAGPYNNLWITWVNWGPYAGRSSVVQGG